MKIIIGNISLKMRCSICFSAYGKTGRMDTDVSESIEKLSTLSLPGAKSWLSKYFIKFRDANTMLLYPKNGNLTTSAIGSKSSIDENIVDDNIIEEEKSGTVINQFTMSDDSIAEKHRHVLLLKKLLEQRLKKRLKEDEEFKPSPKV